MLGTTPYGRCVRGRTGLATRLGSIDGRLDEDSEPRDGRSRHHPREP
jgi:hypothetical protein